ASFLISPITALIVVLFPAPFSPISPTMEPSGTSKETRSKTKSLYVLVSPEIVNALFIVTPPHPVVSADQPIYQAIYRLYGQSRLLHYTVPLFFSAAPPNRNLDFGQKHNIPFLPLFL